MTTHYHYSDGQNQFGPFNIDELKTKKISKDTLIWYEGLDNWTKAGDIPELFVLFKSIPPPLTSTTKTPPPVNTTVNPTPTITQKKKSKRWLILGIVIGIIVIGGITAIVLYNMDNFSSDSGNHENVSNSESSSKSNSKPPREKTPEELRQELYSKEKKKPKDYLSVSYNLDYKVFSGKDVINGTIYNSATMASFKDVVLKVTYSTGTGTELGSEEYVIYKYVYPGSSTSFQIKTVSPSSTKQIGVKIKSAIGE